MLYILLFLFACGCNHTETLHLFLYPTATGILENRMAGGDFDRNLIHSFFYKNIEAQNRQNLRTN